jgi:hypothetical protein
MHCSCYESAILSRLQNDLYLQDQQGACRLANETRRRSPVYLAVYRDIPEGPVKRLLVAETRRYPAGPRGGPGTATIYRYTRHRTLGAQLLFRTRLTSDGASFEAPPFIERLAQFVSGWGECPRVDCRCRRTGNSPSIFLHYVPCEST